jgi:hypothetical protein
LVIFSTGDLELAHLLLFLLSSDTMGYELFLFLITLLNVNPILSIELTFELYDNAKDCFYEVIKENTSVTLEYQVMKPRSFRALLSDAGSDTR